MTKNNQFFNYDNDESYEANFNKWHQLNMKEKTLFNESLYEPFEAKLMFDSLFGHKAYALEKGGDV